MAKYLNLKYVPSDIRLSFQEAWKEEIEQLQETIMTLKHVLSEAKLETRVDETELAEAEQVLNHQNMVLSFLKDNGADSDMIERQSELVMSLASKFNVKKDSYELQDFDFIIPEMIRLAELEYKKEFLQSLIVEISTLESSG
jgi:DNA gyrase/topoisomerase IV subunit A